MCMCLLVCVYTYIGTVATRWSKWANCQHWLRQPLSITGNHVKYWRNSVEIYRRCKKCALLYLRSPFTLTLLCANYFAAFILSERVTMPFCFYQPWHFSMHSRGRGSSFSIIYLEVVYLLESICWLWCCLNGPSSQYKLLHTLCGFGGDACIININTQIIEFLLPVYSWPFNTSHALLCRKFTFQNTSQSPQQKSAKLWISFHCFFISTVSDHNVHNVMD